LSTQNNPKFTIFELALYPMYAALMFASKAIMEILPNVHLIGMFVILFTVVYRARALVPIYIFVFITGLFNGFSVWWVPYIYIWAVLWGFAMLIPKNISKRAAFIVFPIICSLHGFFYGVLYAPFQAVAFGYSFEQAVAWIITGIPWDVVHGVSNFAVGFLIYPLAEVIRRAHKFIR